MSDLLSKKCIPCSIGADPLNKEEIEGLFKELKKGWTVEEAKHLEKTYKFKDFKQALDFTNLVGELAEEEGHHPDIYLSWGKVGINLQIKKYPIIFYLFLRIIRYFDFLHKNSNQLFTFHWLPKSYLLSFMLVLILLLKFFHLSYLKF